VGDPGTGSGAARPRRGTDNPLELVSGGGGIINDLEIDARAYKALTLAQGRLRIFVETSLPECPSAVCDGCAHR
jgi:hypothetical protein